AQKQHPASGKGKPLADRRQPLREPPVFQRRQEIGATGLEAFGSYTPARIEPQRGAWLRHEDAGVAQWPVTGTVEENGVSRRGTRSQAPQDLGRDIELADAVISR